MDEQIKHNWFEIHFDKIALIGLLLLQLGLMAFFATRPDHKEMAQWIREQSNTVLGCLLGLITGGLMRRGATVPPGEGVK